jgi:hypothetical protein
MSSSKGHLHNDNRGKGDGRLIRLMKVNQPYVKVVALDVFSNNAEICKRKEIWRFMGNQERVPVIDLMIVMRQNRTADETLIQIGKGIPRQVDSILD